MKYLVGTTNPSHYYIYGQEYKALKKRTTVLEGSMERYDNRSDQLLASISNPVCTTSHICFSL